jgi:hypothetical protein
LRAFSLGSFPASPPPLDVPGLRRDRDRAFVVSHRAFVVARLVVVRAVGRRETSGRRSPPLRPVEGGTKTRRRSRRESNPASRVVVASRARLARGVVDARSHRDRIASRAHRLIAAPAPGPSSRERFIP